MSGAATRRWPSAPTLVELHTAGRAPPHRWSSLSRPPPVERFPLVELVETTPCRQVVSTRLLATLAAGSTSGKRPSYTRWSSRHRWSSLSRPPPAEQHPLVEPVETTHPQSSGFDSAARYARGQLNQRRGRAFPAGRACRDHSHADKWFRLGSSLRSRPTQPAERVERPRWSSLSRPPLTSSRGSPGTRCCRSSPPRRSPVTVG